jgi:hypothetical protein
MDEYSDILDRLKYMKIFMPKRNIDFYLGKGFVCRQVEDASKQSALCCNKYVDEENKAISFNNFMAFRYSANGMTIRDSSLPYEQAKTLLGLLNEFYHKDVEDKKQYYHTDSKLDNFEHKQLMHSWTFKEYQTIIERLKNMRFNVPQKNIKFKLDNDYYCEQLEDGSNRDTLFCSYGSGEFIDRKFMAFYYQDNGMIIRNGEMSPEQANKLLDLMDKQNNINKTNNASC